MGSQAYQVVKARSRARSASVTLAGQDIGPLPPIKDPARRARADKDFRFFCNSYFPKLFTLPWSADHLKVIAKIEQAVMNGDLYAMAMPRGSGKTTLCGIAALWALLTGRHQFVFLIAATAACASNALHDLKQRLWQNELLLEDYPEVICPIRALEGESRRCGGQRYCGQLTHIEWNADEIVLPTMPGSRCSGAIVRTAGLQGTIRGAVYTRPDGSSVRPSLVVIDDPQTDQSARSPMQVHERLILLNGAILNLAGPGCKLSAIMPCTVIRPNDLADQILNREKHPEWHGERTKMVYSFPTNEKLWEEYEQLRVISQRNDGDGHEATEFYRNHRQEMDEGAVVGWEARHNKDELSALQHAMNLKLRDAAQFYAEYQNEPLPETLPSGTMLTVEEIIAKTNGMKRGVVPIGVTHITAFIDVHADALYWMVCGWASNFTGYILDYGTYPDQKLPYFTLATAKQTLRLVHTGTGQEGAIHAGLTTLTEQLLGRDWRRDDGTVMRIERCLIDAGWKSDVVYPFCRQSSHMALLRPSLGKAYGASNVPISEYHRKPGERIGVHWLIRATPTRPVSHGLFDTNYWKSFVHQRLCVPMGDPGCLSLFIGRDHLLLAEHLTAEYPVTVEAKGRKVDEWEVKPNRDNHWLDCLVGCAVGASMQGVSLSETRMKPATKKIITYAEALKTRKVWSANQR